MAKARLTRDGYARLQAELEGMRARRVEMREEVARTREDGDLRENFPYHAARHALGILEGRVQALELKLADAEILPDDVVPDSVMPGVPFTVEVDGTGRKTVFTLCDESERSFVDNGISLESPLAEAFLDARIGEVCEAKTPRGLVLYKVVAIG